jgi:serine protease Do
MAWPQQVSRRTPVVEVVEKVGPAIVNISTERLVDNNPTPMFDDFFNDFFGKYHPRTHTSRSLGSGVIVDSQGFIVTNAHVIRRASKISVTLSDKRAFSAEVLALDTKNDLAIIKIDSEEPLPSVHWGNSADILIGETVIALGNPFSLQNSVTTGVVSATNRSIALEGELLFDDFIQTDAAINPGNSGGALLNIFGQLIGINTAIVSQGQGLGFAIPVNRVRQTLGLLLDPGKLKQLWLGVEWQETQTTQTTWLLKASRIYPQSPAVKAGIRRGDLVVAVDDFPVHCLFDLNKRLYFKKAGDKVVLHLSSNGIDRDVALEVAAFPAMIQYPAIWDKLGVAVVESRAGLIVQRVRSESSADRIGMQVGDILLSVGGYTMRKAEELDLIVQKVSGGDSVAILLLRKGKRMGGTLVIE